MFYRYFLLLLVLSSVWGLKQTVMKYEENVKVKMDLPTVDAIRGRGGFGGLGVRIGHEGLRDLWW